MQNDTRAGLDQGATGNANESTVDSRPVPQPTMSPPSADTVSSNSSEASSPLNSESSASLPQPTMNPPSADSVSSTELAAASSTSSEPSASANTQANDSTATAVSAQGNQADTSSTTSGTPNPMTTSDPSVNSELTNIAAPTPTPVATPSPDATLSANPASNPNTASSSISTTSEVPAQTAGQAEINSDVTRGNPVNPPSTSQTNIAMASSSNPVQAFGELDTGGKGYLSQPDVASHPFLASNFQRCDVNGDGRLTAEEVTACSV